MKKLLAGFLFAFGLATAYADTFIAKPALHEGVTGVTVTGVTTQLTVLSETIQHLMGSTTQIVALPDATTLKPGRYWVIRNDSSQSAAVRYFGGTALSTVRPGTSLTARLKSAVTSDGDWTLETQDFIRVAGDTMSGNLALGGAGTNPTTVVTMNADRVLQSSVVTPTELGQLTGVTGNVQTQINAKVAKAGDTMTGNLVLPNGSSGDMALKFGGDNFVGLYRQGNDVFLKGTNGSVLIQSEVSGVTRWRLQSAQTALGSGTTSAANPTVTFFDTNTGFFTDTVGAIGVSNNGVESTRWSDTGDIKLSLLPANGALYLDGATVMKSSTLVSQTELERLDGVTANIQTQIDGKVSKAGDTMTGGLTALGGVTSTGIVKVISGTNGALSVISDTSSAGAFLQRTGSATGSMYLGVAGDRNGANTYDEFQVRQGADTQVSFAMRDTDAGVQTLYWGAGTDAFIQRTGSGAFSTPATFTSTATSGNGIVSGASIKANQDIHVGQAGSGTGGKMRVFCDDGNECFRWGPTGASGDRTMTLRGIALNADILAVSTSGYTTFHYQAGMKSGLTNVGGTMYTQIAGVTVANSTAETTLAGASVGTRTIPANRLVAGDTIQASFGGLLGCTGTPNLSMRFKAGATNHVAQTVTPASVDTGGDTENYCDSNLKPFNVTVQCTVRTIGASGTLMCAGGMIDLYANNKAGSKINFGASVSATIDTTTSQTLDLTAQWDAADPANQVQMLTGVIEIR